MSMLYEKGLRPRIREKLVEHRHAVRLFPSGSSTSQTAIQPRPRLLDLMEVAVEVEKMLKEVYDSRGSYFGGATFHQISLPLTLGRPNSLSLMRKIDFLA
jgi:hypothetical protein